MFFLAYSNSARSLFFHQAVTSYCLIFLVGSCQDPMPWSAEVQGTATDAEAATNYWYVDVLNTYRTVEELEARPAASLGGIQGSVVGALFVTWFITFLAMGFGKKLVEKITRKFTLHGLEVVCVFQSYISLTLTWIRLAFNFISHRCYRDWPNHSHE